MSKITLTEIKKGQTGTGLLIENDGYVSLKTKENKQIFESIKLNEESGLMELPRPFVVSAVFQKYGIENANGRIYPESILRREVEKYMQAIKERRAYGECYTGDAECLTENGWVNIKDVKEGDSILTLNTETNKTEYQKVTYKSELDWDGNLISIKGTYIDDLVTPTHKFPVYCFKGKSKKSKFYDFVTASSISDNLSKEYFNEEKTLYIPCEQEIDNDFYSNEKRIFLNARNIKTKNIQYKGKVYCVEVPNHTWFVKQNNKEHWTKNCNHPDSTTIDVSRIALNIVELHWEGSTLLGQIEIPITEGYRKLGIVSCCADQLAHWLISGLKIGVSSRGLGSVQQQMGKLVVGDDYEIVCWDAVSQPSTPNAWIEDSYEKLQPYIESKESSKPIIKEDKFTKFENWLNG